MKFYIASRLNNADAQRELAAALIAQGHQITYDWTLHGSIQDQPDRWAKVAKDEVDGVINADFVIALLPGGQGTHVELGIALCMAVIAGRKLIVIGDDLPQARLGAPYRCLFYNHPMVTQIPLEGASLTSVVASVLKAVAS